MDTVPTVRVPARPYALIIRATERCNVGCAHCCIEATRHGTDMPTEWLQRLLTDAQHAGVALLHLSGGEPLLHADLETFVRMASGRGLAVELTTSTFTEPGESSVARLRALQEAGLQRVMLSYDAAHAERVTIAHYAEFMRAAQELDLEICAMVVEWFGSPWTLQRVKVECEQRGVDGPRVDWCRTGLSLIGRAERTHRVAESPTNTSRCPYVLTAPTLTPQGQVLLCPNAKPRLPLYVLGNIHDRPLATILNDAQASPLYRTLAAHGPHAAAQAAGFDEAAIPDDMCACCLKVLQHATDPAVYDRVTALAPTPDEMVTLPLEELLPAHRRLVLGEERPTVGCLCG